MNYGKFVTEPRKRLEELSNQERQLEIELEEIRKTKELVQFTLDWNERQIEELTDDNVEGRPVGPYSGMSAVGAVVTVLSEEERSLSAHEAAVLLDAGGFKPNSTVRPWSRYLYTALVRETQRPEARLIKSGAKFGLPQWHESLVEESQENHVPDAQQQNDVERLSAKTDDSSPQPTACENPNLISFNEAGITVYDAPNFVPIISTFKVFLNGRVDDEQKQKSCVHLIQWRNQRRKYKGTRCQVRGVRKQTIRLNHDRHLERRRARTRRPLSLQLADFASGQPNNAQRRTGQFHRDGIVYGREREICKSTHFVHVSRGRI